MRLAIFFFTFFCIAATLLAQEKMSISIKSGYKNLITEENLIQSENRVPTSNRINLFEAPKSMSIVSKTVNVSTAGGLYSALTSTELTTVTSLTITGTIDVRDFVTMRDNMTSLTSLDISQVVIASYIGTNGTDTVGVKKAYPANAIPNGAFWNPVTQIIHKLTSIILPSSITKIGDYSFLGNYITNLIIPASVTEIGEWAFQHCYGVTSITLPASLKIIKQCAFSMMGLTSINVPSTVKTMGYASFWANTKLISATLSVQTIGEAALDSCTSLISVDIKESVDTIGYDAFGECFSLPSITIPSSLKYIGYFAFYKCNNLKSMNIPSSVSILGAYALAYCNKLNSANILTQTIDIGAFYGCDSLKSVTFSPNLKSLGSVVFKGCTHLTSIIIPPLVTSIGKLAFYNCSGLKSIEAQNTNPISFFSTDSVFQNVNKSNCVLLVPTGSKASYQTALLWKDFTNIIEMNTAVPSVLNTNLKLYPSQITDNLYISGISETAYLQMIDINGRIVLAKQVSNNETLWFGTLPKGIYIVKLISAEGTAERKVIKI